MRHQTQTYYGKICDYIIKHGLYWEKLCVNPVYNFDINVSYHLFSENYNFDWKLFISDRTVWKR